MKKIPKQPHKKVKHDLFHSKRPYGLIAFMLLFAGIGAYLLRDSFAGTENLANDNRELTVNEELAYNYSYNRETYGLEPRYDDLLRSIEDGSLVFDPADGPFPVLLDEDKTKIKGKLDKLSTHQEILAATEGLDGFTSSEFNMETDILTIAALPGSAAHKKAVGHRKDGVEVLNSKLDFKEFDQIATAIFEDENRDPSVLAMDLKIDKIRVYKDKSKPLQTKGIENALSRVKSTKAKEVLSDLLVVESSPDDHNLEDVGCITRNYCSPARAGSLVMERSSGNNSNRQMCSIGFVVKHRSFSNYGILTAAHCDDIWGGNYYEVGTGRLEYSFPYKATNAHGGATKVFKDKSKYRDLMVLDTRNDFGLTPHYLWHVDANSSIPISGTISSGNGVPVCVAGVNHKGTFCDPIRSATYYDSYVSNAVQVLSRRNIISGDSGGPNIIYDAYSRRYKAAGITRATNTGNNKLYVYTKIGYLIGSDWEVVDSSNYKYDTNISQFLYAFYDLGLNREPDGSGWNYWYNQIKSDCHGASRSLAQTVLTGAEIKNALPLNSSSYWTNRDRAYKRVRRLYKALLGRNADTSGLDYWVGKIMDSKTSWGRENNWKNVVNGFVSGTEFDKRLRSGTAGDIKVCK